VRPTCIRTSQTGQSAIHGSNSLLLIFRTVKSNNLRAWDIWFIVAILLLSFACSRPIKQSNPDSGRSTASAPGQQTLSGRVVRIADGDTITVLDATNTQHRIRLQGIDAPEAKQDFGTQSKKKLSGLVFGKNVEVVYEKTDQYGRLVGKVLLDGRDINLEQVRSGMAWHYKDYEREQSTEDRELYAHGEDEARSARRGLWAVTNPVEPSEFRREERQQRKNAR
jgi:endonuclease YncB( thermonuclease family)